MFNLGLTAVGVVGELLVRGARTRISIAAVGPDTPVLPPSSALPSPKSFAMGGSQLASFPGFVELKRSLREKLRLAAFGVRADEVGTPQDWHAGSLRQKK